MLPTSTPLNALMTCVSVNQFFFALAALHLCELEETSSALPKLCEYRSEKEIEYSAVRSTSLASIARCLAVETVLDRVLLSEAFVDHPPGLSGRLI